MNLSLDHVIIAVHDLEQAIRDYRDLGFTVTRGGVHSNGATQNAIIAFEDGTYLELIAQTGAEPLSGKVDFSTLLPNGEGLVGFALRTETIEAEAARLRYTGVAVGSIISSELTRSDGSRIEWRLLLVDGGYTPFFLQDVTATTLRVPNDVASTTHANRAIGLAGVEMAVRSLNTSRERYLKLLGLTSRQEMFQYARDLALKAGKLYFTEAHPENLNMDWEAYFRQHEPFYSDAIQENIDSALDSPTLAMMRESAKQRLESMQSYQRREAAVWAALSEGKNAEAPFSLYITFDNAPGDSFTLEKTHGVRITQLTGVSRRRRLPIFDKIDAVDWSQVSHAYGPAIDTAANIRALVSTNPVVRDRAYDILIGSIVHQGTVYPATLTALPFLIELLSVPEVPDKHQLLDLIQWCSGYEPNENEINTEGLTPYQREYISLNRSLRHTFLTGMPTYLALIDHPDPKVRQQAASAVSASEQDQKAVEASLLAQRTAETNPSIRAGFVQSLVYFWLPDYEAGSASRLRSEQAAMLAAWMHDANEPPAVRFKAAVCLLQYGGAEWLEESTAVLHQTMQNDSTILLTIGHQYRLIFFEVQRALANYPDRLLSWVSAQATHSIPEIRAAVPFAVYELVSVRRSVEKPIAAVLIGLVHDPSVEVRFQTIVYLGKLKHIAEVRSALQEIAAHESSIPLRERALNEVSQSPTFAAREPDRKAVGLSLEEIIGRIHAAESASPYDPVLSDLEPVLFVLGQQGSAASQAVPLLKRFLIKPDRTGWIQVEALRALWRIAPAEIDEVLPKVLPLIIFLPATLRLFKLFGDMGIAAKSALPLLKAYVESDLRGGGLQGTGNVSWDIELDVALRATAQSAIAQIEQGGSL